MSGPARLIVDSSVAVKWFLPEPLSTEARQVLSGYQSGAYRLMAPDLMLAEVGNVLWKKHRFEGLSLEEAQQILLVLLDLDIEWVPAALLINEALSIAAAYTRTVYDSLYLALSLRRGCPYVTADERLVRAIGSSFPNVVWVASWKP